MSRAIHVSQLRTLAELRALQVKEAEEAARAAAARLANERDLLDDAARRRDAAEVVWRETLAHGGLASGMARLWAGELSTRDRTAAAQLHVVQTEALAEEGSRMQWQIASARSEIAATATRTAIRTAARRLDEKATLDAADRHRWSDRSW